MRSYRPKRPVNATVAIPDGGRIFHFQGGGDFARLCHVHGVQVL